MKSLMITFLIILSVLLQGSTVVASQTTIMLYPVADGYPDSKYPNSAYGKTTFLYVGNSYDHVQDIWGSERIYIRFDLKGLQSDQEIMKATLHLWQYYAPATNQTYETHRVLRDWNEETLNWKNQPPWATSKTSEAVAPPKTEVAVEWDITRDVQAWYKGEAPNYGLMIKAAIEQKAKDASSGFWSREYPVGPHEEWRPRLVLSLRPKSIPVYVASVSVTGLPAALGTDVAVDGQLYQSISPGPDITLVFDRGTTHNISVDNIVYGPPGVRYVCDSDKVEISSTVSLVFNYAQEYFVNITTNPSGVFETPQPGWYKVGTVVPVKRTGGDVVYMAQGMRLVFEGWYMNGQRVGSEPGTIVVSQLSTLEARYRTDCYLNVTSPFGVTSGSGWHEKDSTVSFSVDVTHVTAPGILGMIGLRKVFNEWVGSHDFLGIPSDPQGSMRLREPTSVTAVWEDDWSGFLFNLGIAILVAALVTAAVLKYRKRVSHGKRMQPRAWPVDQEARLFISS